jgi:hypothetical protein
MSDNPWVEMAERILREFETGTDFTVFGVGPDRVMRLPPALGGDPKQWPSLTVSAAKSQAALLDLLWAKAHFLMLPKPIVKFMRNAPPIRLSISEAVVAGAAADTSLDEFPLRSATMHVPGASDYLARVGYELGRAPMEVSVQYDVLGRIYHEMTHAWLWLQEYAGDEIQKLFADGKAAYASASDGTITLNPELAFSEAAAYYVEDRIIRWCAALTDLDRLRRTPVADPDARASRLQAIVAAYDKPRSLYGVVYMDGEPHTIASPAISPALREAIDRTVLDGRPLVKPFAETPLAGLHAALSGP